LIAILLPAFMAARAQSRRTVCATQVHQLGLAIQTYCNDHRGTMPHYSDKPGFENTLRTANSSRHFRVGPTTEGGEAARPDGVFVNLGHLWPRYLRDGLVFYCPSVKKPIFCLDSYLPFPTVNDHFHAGEFLVRVGYNYNPDVKLPGNTQYPQLKDYERLYKRIDERNLRGKIVLGRYGLAGLRR
jgi:hypothetical protein